MVTVEEVRLEIIPLQQRGGTDSANHVANANREDNMSVVSEKSSGDQYSCQKSAQRKSPDSANQAATAKREENMSGDGYSLKRHGQRESPESSNHAANDKREENFSVVPEKPFEDGYNWRKYGQKNIKGNKHIRSYYRCSYQKCLVKKQVERAPDGRITDTSYFGLHEHPKPQTGLGVELPSTISVKVQTGDKHSSLIAKEKPSVTHASIAADSELMETDVLSATPITVEGTHDLASPLSVTKDYRNNDDSLASKRRKIEDDYDISVNDKTKLRWVVETVSAVDIINDGYRWRKYGQKLVKDNPNARSYYRCTNPGCAAKKRVERASHDPKLVITTYEGHHDHDVPHARTLLPHTSPPAPNIASSHNIVKKEDVIRAQSTTAKEINHSQSITVHHKQEQDSTDEPAEKDNPLEEVNPFEKDNAEKVEYHGQSSTGIKEGNTVDHPDEKDSAAPICKQEQDKTIDLPTEKDDPPEKVNLAQDNTMYPSAEKVNPLEEIDQPQSIATSSTQEGWYS